MSVPQVTDDKMDFTTSSYGVPEQTMTNNSPQPAEQATSNNSPQPESTNMQLSQSKEKLSDVAQKGGLTTSTIRKCQLDAKSNFEFSTLSVCCMVYVDPTSYEFIIS